MIEKIYVLVKIERDYDYTSTTLILATDKKDLIQEICKNLNLNINPNANFSYELEEVPFLKLAINK